MRGPERLARQHLAKQVPDPELRAKLTPNYKIGCKRILISSDYLPAAGQPNVDVVTSGISEIREHSIVTSDGAEHAVDTIIFSTGFHVTDMPVATRIAGRDGVVLRDHWKDGMHAHRGSTVAGYPNLFFIVGPNTGLGHTSQVFMIESQIAYVLDALNQVQARGVGVVEVRPEAEEAWNDDVHKAMGRTVWTTGGCASWYLDERGRNTTLWPGFTFKFRNLTRRFDSASYRFRTGGGDSSDRRPFAKWARLAATDVDAGQPVAGERHRRQRVGGGQQPVQDIGVAVARGNGDDEAAARMVLHLGPTDLQAQAELGQLAQRPRPGAVLQAE